MNQKKVISTVEVVNSSSLKKGSGDFVGAIYDTASLKGDLPLALVVGINYGQRQSSASAVNCSQDDVGYSEHVATVGTKSYHTVIWNFFPYLTESEWLEDISNSADEAERIFDRGYLEPFEVFASLVDNLDPELIVFHGISSSVPILARVALRRVGRCGILVPNLSRGLVRSRVKEIA